MPFTIFTDFTLAEWKDLNNVDVTSNLTNFLTTKLLDDLGIGKYLGETCSTDLRGDQQGMVPNNDHCY